MARFSLPLTAEQRKILKDIKYYSNENYSDVILDILDKNLPIKLAEVKEAFELKKKKEQEE